jgi:nitrate reductase delta subunit
MVQDVAKSSPALAAHLAPIARFAHEHPLGECEELYVLTFDANAERALEVGWQVFGEQYERGAFLVDLRGRMRDLGVAETTELPDHLTQVLRLLGRMPADDATTLIDRAVGPTLRRVRGHIQADNPYGGVIDAVAAALDVAAAPEAPSVAQAPEALSVAPAPEARSVANVLASRTGDAR